MYLNKKDETTHGGGEELSTTTRVESSITKEETHIAQVSRCLPILGNSTKSQSREWLQSPVHSTEIESFLHFGN
jgi:hypothetical protein